jgi:hypothetical protein
LVLGSSSIQILKLVDAHAVWGDSRGNLAEVGLNDVTKRARRSSAGVSSSPPADS